MEDISHLHHIRNDLTGLEYKAELQRLFTGMDITTFLSVKITPAMTKPTSTFDPAI